MAAPWASECRTVDSSLNLASNVVRASAVAVHCTQIYDSAVFSADQEAWCVLSGALANVGTELGVFLRVNAEDTAGVDFIHCTLQYDGGTSYTAEICASINDSANYAADVASGSLTATFTAGDILYANVIGKVITMFLYNGGTWTQILQTTMDDITTLIVNGAGKTGLRLYAVTATTAVGVTAFGGGAIGDYTNAPAEIRETIEMLNPISMLD